jgi:hypothetical protein
MAMDASAVYEVIVEPGGLTKALRLACTFAALDAMRAELNAQPDECNAVHSASGTSQCAEMTIRAKAA